MTPEEMSDLVDWGHSVFQYLVSQVDGVIKRKRQISPHLAGEQRK